MSDKSGTGGGDTIKETMISATTEVANVKNTRTPIVNTALGGYLYDPDKPVHDPNAPKFVAKGLLKSRHASPGSVRGPQCVSPKREETEKLPVGEPEKISAATKQLPFKKGTRATGL